MTMTQDAPTRWITGTIRRDTHAAIKATPELARLSFSETVEVMRRGWNQLTPEQRLAALSQPANRATA